MASPMHYEVRYLRQRQLGTLIFSACVKWFRFHISSCFAFKHCFGLCYRSILNWFLDVMLQLVANLPALLTSVHKHLLHIKLMVSDFWPRMMLPGFCNYLATLGTHWLALLQSKGYGSAPNMKESLGRYE